MNDERPRLRNRRTFVIATIIALVALVSLGGGGGLATAKSRDSHGPKPALARHSHGTKPTIVLAVPPALQETMSTRAGAHISTVNAGHLSLITRPRAVTKIILTAIAATT